MKQVARKAPRNILETLLKSTLKKVLSLVMAIGVAAMLTACERHSGPVLETLEGDAIVIGQQDGKALFINFWAEWCAPCRDEIPELNELYGKYGDRLIVLAVNADGVSGDALNEQLDRMGIEFPSLPGDPRPIWGQTPTGALPETLVITPDGQLHDVLLGAQTGEDLLAILEAIR